MLTKKILFVISFSIAIFIILLNKNTISQIRDRSIYSRRDPFSLPSGIFHISNQPTTLMEKKVGPSSQPKPHEVKSVEIPLKLKAILIGDHIRLASINQRILTIGDEINGEKILEIHSDRVILGKGKDRRTILLDQSPLKIKVE